MLILGIVLLLVGWLLGIGLLVMLGLILAVIGVVLLLAGATGHAVGGRSHYW